MKPAQTSGRILAIHHVTLLVEDLARSLAFYVGTLGLVVNRDRPDMGFPGAWLDVGADHQIHLMRLPSPDLSKGRPEHGGRDRHFALRVDDLDAVLGRLEQAGMRYARSRSGRPAAFCRDPDGNAIELIQAD